jgi:hypothetical protein
VFALNRCQDLLGIASGIGSIKIKSFDVFLLQTIPLMLSLGKKDQLRELILKSACSEKEKQDLRMMIGDSDD